MEDASLESMIPIKCSHLDILIDFAVKLHEKSIVSLNQIITEGPKRIHRPVLLTLLGKIGMGIRRIEAIQDIEMGPTLRMQRDELKEIQMKARELYMIIDAEGQLE